MHLYRFPNGLCKGSCLDLTPAEYFSADPHELNRYRVGLNRKYISQFIAEIQRVPGAARDRYPALLLSGRRRITLLPPLVRWQGEYAQSCRSGTGLGPLPRQ